MLQEDAGLEEVADWVRVLRISKTCKTRSHELLWGALLVCLMMTDPLH